MRGGIRQIIGVIVLLLIFMLVMMVMLCSFSSELMLCPMFQPILDLVDSFMYTG